MEETWMFVGFPSIRGRGISKIGISQTRVENWTPTKIEDSWIIEIGWWWGSSLSRKTKWTIETINYGWMGLEKNLQHH